MSNIKCIILIIACLALPCSAQSFKPSAPYAGGNSGVSPNNGLINPSAPYAGGNSGAAPNNGLVNVEQKENTVCPTSGRVIRGAGGFLMPNHDCTDNQNNQNN